MMPPANERLLHAAENNDRKAALQALRDGANPHTADPDGTTAAMWFAYHDNLEAVLHLIDYSPAIVSDVNAVKQTPVLEFAKRHNWNAVVLMACIDKRILRYASADGFTAAMYFARSQRVDALHMVAMLDPDCLLHTNAMGTSAASLLGSWGNVDGIRLLLRVNPKISQMQVVLQVLHFALVPPEVLLDMVAKLLELGFERPLNIDDLLAFHGFTPEQLDAAIAKVRQ